MTVRVALVDDELLMREGLRALLETEPDLRVVAEASDGTEAVRVVRESAPDVVLMDIRMPGRDGIWATREIVAGGTPARVVVLTTFDHDDSVISALRAGACGYLLKSTPAERLIGAVRAAAAGEHTLSPAIVDSLVAHAVRSDVRRRESSRVLERLTSREREVLLLMVRGATNDEIGAALFISQATVKSHVGQVLAKLGARDRVQAVIMAYEAGLVVPGQA